MKDSCSLDEQQVCRMEERIEDVVENFSRLAEKLTDNQIEMRMNIVKLTENMNDLSRVHVRVDKVEEDVKKITPLVYKMVGVCATCAVVLPVAIEYFTR